ncbi:MAG: S4 domain-containing protein [Eubacteriales bacterium]
MRLDKYLCEAGYGTRSEVKKLLRSGVVTVNGEKITKPETKI